MTEYKINQLYWIIVKVDDMEYKYLEENQKGIQACRYKGDGYWEIIGSNASFTSVTILEEINTLNICGVDVNSQTLPTALPITLNEYSFLVYKMLPTTCMIMREVGEYIVNNIHPLALLYYLDDAPHGYEPSYVYWIFSSDDNISAKEIAEKYTKSKINITNADKASAIFSSSFIIFD